MLFWRSFPLSRSVLYVFRCFFCVTPPFSRGVKHGPFSCTLLQGVLSPFCFRSVFARKTLSASNGGLCQCPEVGPKVGQKLSGPLNRDSLPIGDSSAIPSRGQLELRYPLLPPPLGCDMANLRGYTRYPAILENIGAIGIAIPYRAIGRVERLGR